MVIRVKDVITEVVNLAKPNTMICKFEISIIGLKNYFVIPK